MMDLRNPLVAAAAVVLALLGLLGGLRVLRQPTKLIGNRNAARRSKFIGAPT